MDKKRIIMGGATLACIGAIGFVMQGGKQGLPMAAAGLIGGGSDTAAPVEIADISLTSADTELAKKPAASAVTMTDRALPQIEAQIEAPAEVQLQPAAPAAPSVTATLPAAPQPVPAPPAPTAIAGVPGQMSGDMPATAKPAIEEPTTISLLDTATTSPMPKTALQAEPRIGDQCELTMTGTEVAGALVKLDLNAPCLPNERVTLQHSEMMFTETTDDKGRLSLAVPALTKNAVFIAAFPNSEGAVANVTVTTLDLYDRAVVQSDFASAIQLHALEFGSGYDGAGHVWANAPGDIADAAIGRGGFMTVLGNPAVAGGTMAEVYTFPSGLAEEAGDVALSVEIEVTNMNCGHEIQAQSFEVKAGGQPKAQRLDLIMPDCDAVGDFLVLKNLVDDLKVASNTQ